MKTKIIIILLTVFFLQSYSQEFDGIKYNLELQAKYKDTLRNIGDRLTGKWKYLGKKDHKILIDTLSLNFRDDEKTYVVVENGTLFEIRNGKRKEANYYYEITYNFDNSIGYYSEDKIYFDSNIIESYSSQPYPELIYYQNKFGILFVGHGGESFEVIRELNSEKLIFENGEEYLKIE